LKAALTACARVNNSSSLVLVGIGDPPQPVRKRAATASTAAAPVCLAIVIVPP
jgi:hypothetical protein